MCDGPQLIYELSIPINKSLACFPLYIYHRVGERNVKWRVLAFTIPHLVITVELSRNRVVRTSKSLTPMPPEPKEFYRARIN